MTTEYKDTLFLPKTDFPSADIEIDYNTAVRVIGAVEAAIE